ncbi:hypothetical protein D3C81_2142970 [compost metagenome]
MAGKAMQGAGIDHACLVDDHYVIRLELESLVALAQFELHQQCMDRRAGNARALLQFGGCRAAGGEADDPGAISFIGDLQRG